MDLSCGCEPCQAPQPALRVSRWPMRAFRSLALAQVWALYSEGGCRGCRVKSAVRRRRRPWLVGFLLRRRLGPSRSPSRGVPRLRRPRLRHSPSPPAGSSKDARFPPSSASASSTSCHAVSSTTTRPHASSDGFADDICQNDDFARVIDAYSAPKGLLEAQEKGDERLRQRLSKSLVYSPTRHGRPRSRALGWLWGSPPCTTTRRATTPSSTLTASRTPHISASTSSNGLPAQRPSTSPVSAHHTPSAMLCAMGMLSSLRTTASSCPF